MKTNINFKEYKHVEDVVVQELRKEGHSVYPGSFTFGSGNGPDGYRFSVRNDKDQTWAHIEDLEVHHRNYNKDAVLQLVKDKWETARQYKEKCRLRNEKVI